MQLLAFFKSVKQIDVDVELSQKFRETIYLTDYDVYKLIFVVTKALIALRRRGVQENHRGQFIDYDKFLSCQEYLTYKNDDRALLIKFGDFNTDTKNYISTEFMNHFDFEAKDRIILKFMCEFAAILLGF